ncbi:MAG TPA: prolipoprotein diacylglyceryl transferase family protein, partial [Dehalococcoidia bacterium]|nr:prolipoprotein diacylglyceryl transferase family protein [Dehalococcoidia bacterium]
MDALRLLTITIGIDPEIAKFGGLLLTWHGVFTAVGIAAGVYFAVLAARKVNYLNDDEAYTIALIGVPSAIIGARALYVMERWDEEFAHDLWSIFAVNEGGISIYGAV